MNSPSDCIVDEAETDRSPACVLDIDSHLLQRLLRDDASKFQDGHYSSSRRKNLGPHEDIRDGSVHQKFQQSPCNERQEGKGSNASAVDKKECDVIDFVEQIKTNEDAASRLVEDASYLCERGKEEEALKAYHRALHLTLPFLKDEPLESNSITKGKYFTIVTSADIYLRIANIHEQKEDFKAAIAACRDARDLYLNHRTTSGSFGKSVKKISSIVKRFEKAIEASTTRRRLHEHATQMHNKATAVQDPTTKFKILKKVSNTLQRVLQLELDSLGESHPSVANTIGCLGSISIEMNHVDLALEQLSTAASTLLESLGQFHPDTGRAYSELGSTYHSRRRDSSDFVAAINCYKKAITAFRESYGEHHVVIGWTLNRIAGIYFEQEELDAAIETLSDSLAIYEKQETGSGVHPDTAHVWKNLGNVYYQRKSWEVAILSYTAALEIQMTRPHSNEAPTSTLRGDLRVGLLMDEPLADTLEKLGSANAAVGRSEEAMDMYKCALRIRLAVVDAGATLHNKTESQSHLAYNLLCLAKVCETGSHLSEALSYYGRSLQVSHSIENGFESAVALTGIGSVHIKMEAFEKAIEVLEGALDVFENAGLPRDHKAVRNAKMKLIEAKVCKKSESRHDSTISELKRQLEELTDQLRATEDENHRLHKAISLGTLPLVAEVEDAVLCKQFSNEEQDTDTEQSLCEVSAIDQQRAGLHCSRRGGASDTSIPSQSTSLDKYLSKEAVTTKNPADVESCDTKKICVQKVMGGKDSFIVNIDFETLFRRELAEADDQTDTTSNDLVALKASQLSPIADEEEWSLSSFFEQMRQSDMSIKEAMGFDLESAGLSADKSILSLVFSIDSTSVDITKLRR